MVRAVDNHGDGGVSYLNDHNARAHLTSSQGASDLDARSSPRR